jgi:hypothetical protein
MLGLSVACAEREKYIMSSLFYAMALNDWFLRKSKSNRIS